MKVFLDTETTGLNDNAELIEIAITDASGHVLFESFCKPTVAVEAGAQSIHNIGMSQLVNAPEWPQIADKVREVLEGKTVVIFNADFDTRILYQTQKAHGLCSDWLKELRLECAMMQAANKYGATNKYGTISLINAVKAAGIEFIGEAHRAAGDAATTAALYKEIHNEHGQDQER
jgi:DNA polymerase-3 subunit epsilon